jgi:hypothetical protein
LEIGRGNQEYIAVDGLFPISVGGGHFFMTTFLAIYRGNTVSDAKMIAVSADPSLVSSVAERMLKDPRAIDPDDESDAAIVALSKGRRAALQLIAYGSSD